tara:strand:+ start:668 stop:1102 length:435 start_codon:yes stop_codon:yes gene_type:complete
MRIAIGCDHAGYEMKEKILVKYDKINFIDCGTFSVDSVDYPDFGHKVGMCVLDKSDQRCNFGIIICGSGIGISIAANKLNGIRAALCHTSEHAKLSRQHNDANVLALGARLTEEIEIFSIIDTFLETDFEGGRHQQRINKIEIK